MAFEYNSGDSIKLTKSQEELFETIENLPFPFGGISKLKDLRDIIKLVVYVSEGIDWESYMSQYNALHGEFYNRPLIPSIMNSRKENTELIRNYAEIIGIVDITPHLNTHLTLLLEPGLNL